MFYNPEERNETDYGDGAVVFEPLQNNFTFWFLFGLDNTVQLAVLSLNLLLLLVKAFDTEKIFKCCSFYTIVTGFSMLMILQSSTRLLYSFCTQITQTAQAARMAAGAAMITDMFASYYSAVLIFLISCNRYAVYANPFYTDYLFKKKNLAILLCVSAVLMFGFSHLIAFLSESRRSYDSEMGIQVDSVTNMGLITTVVSAGPQLGIPISVIVFNPKMRVACKNCFAALLPFSIKTSRVGSASSNRVAFPENK